MSSKVAIVGAGPSGLAACRAALQEGLTPTLFDSAGGVGGVWRQDGSGQVWQSLRTNLSKYTCAFSDAPWPESAPDFPSGAEVQAYLERYAARNGFFQHTRLNSRVTSISRDGRGGWLVSWESEAAGGAGSEVFDRVLVATGIFSKPHDAALPGSDGFPGELLHAASYREPSPFRGKRVLVVGGAFSGADVAADIANGGSPARVVVASRRPLWYLPRFVGGRPADLVFYSRKGSDGQADATEEQRNATRHAFFRSLVGDLLAPSLKAPDPSRGDLPFVAISDAFLDAVRSGRVIARATDVVRLEGRAAVFGDGHREEFDVVIMATGYRLELPFLSRQDQDSLELDSNDLLQPAILHECVWRPELPGVAFAGLYRGPYFAAMELQARWACGVFSGRLPAPTAAELAAGLEAERRVRAQRPRPQFPHGDYVGMSESLARRVGVHPEEIMEGDPHGLGKLLYEGPLLPFHYRLVGFGSEKAVAEAAIRECSSKYPMSSL